MRLALNLARRGVGRTSPNPMVGAVLERGGRLVGQGWHHGAGLPHAEIEALRDAEQRGCRVDGATLYVTLEPCCTRGRTPPCTEAILASGVRRVVVAATDPNPAHRGRAFTILREAGVEVVTGILEDEATALNEAFNHWIVHRTPFVVLKAAMTLDGKIATVGGESKWITGKEARGEGMRLRAGADAILVGVGTVLADDPSLTVRGLGAERQGRLRRIVLDSKARTPLGSRVVTDADRGLTMVVVTPAAARRRVEALARRVRVLEAPAGAGGRVDVGWLMARLGEESVTRLLVEGGSEVQGTFVRTGWVQRVAFFYAPLLVGGAEAARAVGGEGAQGAAEILGLEDVRWRRLGADLYYTARVRVPEGEEGSGRGGDRFGR